MLKAIVNFLNLKLELLNYFDLTRCLCELKRKGDVVAPKEYIANGEWQNIDFDSSDGVSYWRLRDKITVSRESNPNKALKRVQTTVPMKLVFSVRRDKLTADDAYSFDRIRQTIVKQFNIDNGALTTALGAAKVTITAPSSNGDPLSVWDEETSGTQTQEPDFKYVFGSIDIDIVIDSDTDCLPTECDDVDSDILHTFDFCESAVVDRLTDEQVACLEAALCGTPDPVTEQVNGVTIGTAESGTTNNQVIENSNGDAVGTSANPSVVGDSTVENSDASYSASVKAEGSLVLPDTDIKANGDLVISQPSTIEKDVVVRYETQGVVPTTIVSGEVVVPDTTVATSVSLGLSNASPVWDETLTLTATASGFTPTNYAFYARNARETKLLYTGAVHYCNWVIDMPDVVTVYVIATDGSTTEIAEADFTITGFITIWEIWRQGTIDELDFPTNSAGTYNCDIYYSDGTSYLGVTTYNDVAWTHTFPSNSKRVWVRIEGTYSHLRFPSRNDIVSVVQFGGASIDTNWAFFNCKYLESIIAIDAPVLNATNALDSIFYNATRLIYVDWTNWDTSNQTTLYRAFYSNQVITPENNVGFTEIDTSNITNFQLTLRQSRGGDLKLRFIDWSSVTNATQFLVSSPGTTVDDYDQTLQNLLATSPIPSGINFHFGSSKYTSGGAGETARTALITTYGNTITDGGAA